MSFPSIPSQEGKSRVLLDMSLQSITLSCIAPLARPRKPVGGEIALNARSEPSPGRRTTGFDWSAVRSPLQPFGFTPPHRTRNGSAVTKVHERFRMFGRFRKFSSGIPPLLNIPNLLNLLNMLNPKPFPIPHNFRAFRDGSKSRFVSAASDEPRKGETELVAPLKAKP